MKKKLFRSQYGYRKNRSTEHALLELIDRVTKSMESGKFCLGLFIDLSKAFDTIDHNILFSKLENYGIRGTALEWFKSYLSNRKQYVKFKDTLSEEGNITHGVPQGSILGPLLFLIYINDLGLFLDNEALPSILYADDTNILMSNMFIEELFKKANVALEKVNDWLLANKLSISTDKTKFMLFHTSQNGINIPKDGLPNLILNGNNIKRATETEFLGVTIQENLNWKPHIEKIQKKVAKVNGIMSKLKYELPNNILKMIYNTLLLPYLNYCLLAWGNSEHTEKLLLQQKKAVRTLTHFNFITHSDPLFKEAKILKISDLYKIKVLTFMNQYQSNVVPEYFRDFFEPLMLQRNYDQIKENVNRKDAEGANARNIISKIKLPRLTITEKSAKYFIPSVYRNLPEDILQGRSLEIRKNRLKHHTLENYQGDFYCNEPNCYACKRLVVFFLASVLYLFMA